MDNGIINSLDKNTRVNLLKKFIGFNELPVSIDQFIHDDYYLGKECGIDYETGREQTYKIWQDALQKIFPDPITTNTFVALNGAIGTGKSRCSKIILAYQLHKLLCTKDFYSYNELNERNKPHVFFIGHTDKYKAQANLTEFLDMLHASPYFEEQFNDPDSVLNKNVLFISGREPGDFIGKNVVCGWI